MWFMVISEVEQRAIHNTSPPNPNPPEGERYESSLGLKSADRGRTEGGCLLHSHRDERGDHGPPMAYKKDTS